MARLNETAATAVVLNARVSDNKDQLTTVELEAVKRSLMRQNRNLAKSHSAQSLQIRTLGTQISNLLATNTALAEENIRLRREASEARHNPVSSGIESLKDALNARLQDMVALVNNMERQVDHSISPQASPETRKSMCLESMQFRDRPSLREIMAETQMPAIPELSTVPELFATRLSDASVDSDLGPPPVARFESDEAISCELAPAIENSAAEKVVAASINTDVRRRRKDSVGTSQGRRRSTFVAPLLDDSKCTSSPKAGAKRKLADRDHEDAVPAVKEDDSLPRQLIADETKSIKTPLQTDSIKPITLKPIRKVLGDKSTNISPKKARIAVDKEDVLKESKPAQRKPSDRRTSRQLRLPAMPVVSIELEPEQQDGEYAPKTPAALELLSPVSSEPASRGVGKADTPPPADLGMASSTITEGVRPSRRARAAVNYAEPSLVAKMRRPGKEMLDALSGLQDPRSVMSTSSREPKPDEKTDAIDAEFKAQNRRSPLPKKGEVIPEVETSPIDDRSIATSMSLAALMAGSRASSSAKTVDVLKEELDIFEFKDTTPPDSPNMLSTDHPGAAKGSRRHSATSKSSADCDLKVKNEHASVRPSSRAALRRKSMMV